MNDNIISAADIMMRTINTSLIKGMELPSIWKEVVSRIGENTFDETKDEMVFGEKLANNSHVVDLKNGVLLIEANHSGWIQYLKMYQRFILNGINRKLPDLKIKNLAFRVAGSNVSLSESYDEKLKKDMEEMNKKVENNEKILNEMCSQKNSTEKKELPPELLQRFDSIRQTMLTNTKE